MRNLMDVPKKHQNDFNYPYSNLINHHGFNQPPFIRSNHSFPAHEILQEDNNSAKNVRKKSRNRPSNDSNLQSTSHSSQFPSENDHSNKRQRRSFNHFQLSKLEESFQKCMYADLNCRNNLCKLLNIPESTIQIWFQNRRAKVKKTENYTDKVVVNNFVK